MNKKKAMYGITLICMNIIIAIAAFTAGSSISQRELIQEIDEMHAAYAELEKENAHLAASAADKEVEENSASQRANLAENNPVDEYFNEWGKELSGVTIEMNVFGANYAASWKAEMLHAYEMLSEMANPHSEQLQSYISQSQNLYLDFADNDSDLEGLVCWSDGFWYMRADVGHTEEISIGSGYPSGVSAAKATLYKQQTIRLYDMLEAIGVQPDFVFDAGSLDDVQYGDYSLQTQNQ